MTAVTIRALDPSEWELFRDFRLAALQSTPGVFASSYAEAAARTPEQWRADIGGTDHHQVFVSARASNAASRRANERFGFVETHRASQEWPDGTTDDEVFYRLQLRR